MHVNESVTLTPPFTYGPTKTYAQRKVNLPSFLLQPLAELIAPYANDPDGFVFRSPNRPTLVYGTFYTTTFKPAVRRSLPPSLHGLRFHDLRHTAAALMVDLSGADAYLVMRRMGHSSITVTYDRYAKLFPERDAEIVTGLEAGRTRATTTTVTEPTAEVGRLR